MKLINSETDSYEYFCKHEYFFDSLRTAEDIKELLKKLQAQGCSLKKLKFIYVHDDCICKPDIEFLTFDDFLETSGEIDAEDLRTITLKFTHNGLEIHGNINIDLNLLELFIERDEAALYQLKF